MTNFMKRIENYKILSGNRRAKLGNRRTKCRTRKIERSKKFINIKRNRL